MLRLALAATLLGSMPTVDPDGRLDLSRLHGRVVWVDFWASWCGPCAASFPWMAEMTRKHGERGLQVIAINLDAERADADRFLRTNEVPFPVLFDPEGRIAQAYGVQAMPSSILFDRDGRPVATHEGFHPDAVAAYEQAIVAALNGAPVAQSRTVSDSRPPWLGVRPWEREILARREMLLGADGLELATDEHIYFSKEASSGGRGFGGGGCGCN